MSRDRLRAGIIGCGKVTSLHAGALAQSARAEFRAVCSRSRPKGEAFAARYGVNAYTDVAEMVAAEALDVVIVCTPHPDHLRATRAAAAGGAHVLVEKPLASTLADCDAMLEACREAGVTLGMVSQRRFYPPCVRMKEAIEAGKIGAPILGTATLLGWRDPTYYESDAWRGTWAGEGGGVLVNQAPHLLDLLQWFMGPIAEVFGYWGNLNHPSIEVEDTAVAVIRFRNGGLGALILSNSQHPALWGKILVHGANGASVGVQTDGGAMFIAGVSEIEEAPINDVWTVAGEADRLAEWQAEDRKEFGRIHAMEYYHQLQVEDFLAAVLEDRPPAVTGEDGRKSVEMFSALYRSQRDGRPVRFPVQPEADGGHADGRPIRGTDP